jgi:Uma2 family endonuclease
MAANPQTRHTIEDYLAMERDSEIKHEYFQGEIFAMAGASPEHVDIRSNAQYSLMDQIKQKKKSCKVHDQDMRVKTGSGLYTYPDISITCGKRLFNQDKPPTLLNPTVVIEVLSPSTSDYDRGDKFHHYRTITGFQAYILIDSSKPRIEIFERTPDGTWRIDVADTPDGVIEIASIGCTLSIADVYDGVAFDDEVEER